MNEPFYGNSNALHIYLHCLMKAAFEPCQAEFDRKPITLQRGQFVSSATQIAAETGMSRSAVQHNLKALTKQSRINQQPSRVNTLFTVVSYDSEQANNHGTITEQSESNHPISNKKKEVLTRVRAGGGWIPSDEVVAADAVEAAGVPRLFAVAKFYEARERGWHDEKGAPIRDFRSWVRGAFVRHRQVPGVAVNVKSDGPTQAQRLYHVGARIDDLSAQIEQHPANRDGCAFRGYHNEADRKNLASLRSALKQARDEKQRLGAGSA